MRVRNKPERSLSMKNSNRKWLRLVWLMLAVTLLIMPQNTMAAENLDISNQTEASLVRGRLYELSLSVAETVETENEIIWNSSDPSVATVNPDGTLKARKKGTSLLTGTVGDTVYSCTVTVKRLVTKVVLNKAKRTMKVGKTYTLKATVTPNAASDKRLKWTSSNKAVAKVNSKGTVTAVSPGTATITAKAKDGSGKKAVCKITVKEVPSAMSISSTSLTIRKGESSELTVSNTGGAAVYWGSSDTNVATVSDGKVTAVGTGTAVIAARTADGSQTVYCKVTVTEAVDDGSAVNPPAGASVTAQQFLAVLQKYSDRVKSDYAAGIKWTYSNSGVASTWKSAVSKNQKCNCALLARWGLRDLGIIDSKNFWGLIGGGIEYRGDVKEQLLKHCEIIPVYKTPNQLLAEGNLLSGDICTYVEYQHTNVYAGNGLWYDAGRGVNYTGGAFTSFGPAAAVNMSNTTIGHIIRIVR